MSRFVLFEVYAPNRSSRPNRSGSRQENRFRTVLEGIEELAARMARSMAFRLSGLFSRIIAVPFRSSTRNQRAHFIGLDTQVSAFS